MDKLLGNAKGGADGVAKVVGEKAGEFVEQTVKNVMGKGGGGGGGGKAEGEQKEKKEAGGGGGGLDVGKMAGGLFK